jgi:hypothetical protein
MNSALTWLQVSGALGPHWQQVCDSWPEKRNGSIPFRVEKEVKPAGLVSSQTTPEVTQWTSSSRPGASFTC